MRKILHSLSLCVVCAIAGLLATPRVCGAPLGGTYLQLTSDHGRWEPAKWIELFSSFGELGLSELIIQWTVYEDTAFYSPSKIQPVVNPPLEMILDLAAQSHMQVLVGLAHDPDYWTKVQRDTSLVEVYLKRLRTKSLDIAQELFPIVSKYPAFKGWYICEEIDDKNWLASSARTILIQHLSEQTRELKVIAPTAVVGISGFSNGFADPAVFRSLWGQILDHASLDLLLFQDGFGTGAQDSVSLPLYLKALQEVVASRQIEAQIIIELFEQRSREEQTFKAEPASLARVVKQLDIAGNYFSKEAVAFSIPEYMTPMAGAAARKLYQDYRRHYYLKVESTNSPRRKSP